MKKPHEKIRELDRKELLEIWQIYRSYLEHEDMLVIQRTTWFITINAFIFASLAFSSDEPAAGSNLPPVQAFWLVLALVGITISITTLLSVQAAQKSIEKLVERWEHISSHSGAPRCKGDEQNPVDFSDNTSEFPALAGGGTGITWERGWISSRALPWTMIVLWLIIGLYSLCALYTICSPQTAPAGCMNVHKWIPQGWSIPYRALPLDPP